MRSPIAYYGGKQGMAQKIIQLMPPHQVYIEPFFGSGAVFFAKAPARHEILNDLDDSVVTFFRVLRDRPKELEDVCALTPHSRTEFAAADLDDPDLDDLERARRFWVRVSQSFAKHSGQATGWSITTGRTQSIPATAFSRMGRFAGCAHRLAGASFENCDAAGLINRLGCTPGAVIFVDPPYLPEARASHGTRHHAAKGDYRVDMLDPEEHQRLAVALHAAAADGAIIILAGYHSELYDELYADWTMLEFEATAHSSKAHRTGSRSKSAATRKARTEVLWTNQPVNADRLFD